MMEPKELLPTPQPRDLPDRCCSPTRGGEGRAEGRAPSALGPCRAGQRSKAGGGQDTPPTGSRRLPAESPSTERLRPAAAKGRRAVSEAASGALRLRETGAVPSLGTQCPDWGETGGGWRGWRFRRVWDPSQTAPSAPPAAAAAAQPAECASPGASLPPCRPTACVRVRARARYIQRRPGLAHSPRSACSSRPSRLGEFHADPPVAQLLHLLPHRNSSRGILMDVFSDTPWRNGFKHQISHTPYEMRNPRPT
ncbi:uncharacterized protein RHO17_019002 [Thomomys bottae]